MIDNVFHAHILPKLLAHKIILAFAGEGAIQRTADAFEQLGVPKSQLFGLIGQNEAAERVGLDIAYTFVPLPECTLAFEIRAYHNALTQLSAVHMADIDKFDPEGKAIVIGPFWFSLPTVAGRRVFGFRRPKWILYEDKCAVSAIWDKAGIVQAKSTVVPVSSLRNGLPEGWAYPLVISGDSSNGMTGGGSHVRAIHSDAQLEAQLGFFEDDCEQLRLMDYVDGTSCSIHGVVLEHTVLSSIPIEMVVVPRADGKFIYMGASTHWAPSPSELTHLQDIVQRVGAALRDDADFRGTFTIDGVFKAGQFYPTEINTRAGAGIFALYGPAQLSYYLLDLMLKDAQDIPIDPARFQEWMWDIAQGSRSTRAWGGADIDGPVPNEKHALVFQSGEWIRIADDSDGASTLTISEGRTGAFLQIYVASDTLEAGELLLPYVKAAMHYSDKQWHTQFLSIES